MFRRLRTGIRFKILAVSLAAIAVSTIGISVASVQISSSVLREKMEASASEVLSLTARDIASLFETIVRFTDYIALIDEVREILSGEVEEGPEEFFLRKQVDAALERFAISTVQPYVRSLKIFGEADNAISFGANVFFLDERRVRSLIAQVADSEGLSRGVWFGMHEQFDTLGRERDFVVSFARSTSDPDTGEYLATIYMSFNAVIVSSLLPSAEATSGTIYVADQDGRIVASTADVELMSSLSAVMPERSDRLAAPFSVGRFVSPVGWTIHYVLDRDAWTSQQRAIILLTLLAFGVTLTGTVAVELLLVRGITRPMEELSNTLMRIHDGDLSARAADYGNDEIGEMARSFNYMVDRITGLMETEVETERKKRNAEFEALQAKMNPHFIYNTLSTIRWMSLMHDAKPVANAIEILGRLLARTTYAHGEFTTISDELASLEDYVTIQKLRYKGKFEVEVDAASDTLECECPRFTLQPIVENSIFHGIQPKQGTGLITISICRSEAGLRIAIQDDGVGYPRTPKRESTDHLGLSNLDERIRLHYGAQFGLSVTSDHESYTRVEVHLPTRPGVPNA